MSSTQIEVSLIILLFPLLVVMSLVCYDKRFERNLLIASVYVKKPVCLSDSWPMTCLETPGPGPGARTQTVLYAGRGAQVC